MQALAANGRAMMLRDLAKAAGMPAAKAHRYLVSLIRMGLVEQDQTSGRYDLGSFSLELGLAAMGRLDPVRLATPILEDLCERLGETVALAVWGNHGATVVRLLEAGGPITVALRAGTVLPLASSATGRAFAAFFRSPYLRQLLEVEIKANAEANGTTLAAARRDMDGLLSEIRNQGIARASGSYSPGINGFQCAGIQSDGHHGGGNHFPGADRQLCQQLGQQHCRRHPASRPGFIAPAGLSRTGPGLSRQTGKRERDGAGYRNRTGDLRITSALLYLLS